MNIDTKRGENERNREGIKRYWAYIEGNANQENQNALNRQGLPIPVLI